MQKSKIEKEAHTEDKILNLPRATSLGKTTNPTNPTDVVTNEDIQSDSIPKPTKIKAGSRFISAIRKISGSNKTSKQSKAKAEKQTTDNIVLCREDEELPTSIDPTELKETELKSTKEDNKKKKLKFSKRLLGGSSTKSKCKNDVEEPKNLSVRKSKSTEISKTSETISEYEHSIKSPEKVKITQSPTTTGTTGTTQPLDRIQKVQITISGKKIEHTKIDHKQGSITTTTTKITGGTRSEKEYLLHNPNLITAKLTTIPTNISGLPTSIRDDNVGGQIHHLENQTVKENDDILNVKENKRFETKKLYDETENASETKTISQTVTELNNEDKPTHTATVQEPIAVALKSTTVTHTTTGAKEIHTPTKFTSERLVIVTESTRDTPPSEKAPTKPNRDSEQKIAKRSGIAPHRATTRTTPVLVLPAIVKRFKSTTAQAVTEAEEKRSPDIFNTKTSKKLSNLMQNPLETSQRGHRLPKPTNTTNINTTLPTTINPTASDHKTDSHATQSLTNLALSEQDSSREQQKLAQSGSTAESLSIPLQPAVSQAPLTNISDSVNIETANSQDEIIFSGKRDNLEQDQPSLNFVVGSIVQVPPKLVSFDIELDHNLDQQLDSVGSNISSDSQTPVSDSSRKRQRYIAKPSLTEELVNSGDNSCEEIPFLKTISRRDYTLDSDIEDNIENPQMPAFGDLTMDQEMEPTIMASGPTEKREHLYKILVIGELGTGKTSFIKRYVHQFFSQNYRATIGVDFALKVLHWDNNTIVRLQLWDIAGQERFGNMTRVYYKEAVGAFIVFDVTRSGTFDCVSKWKEDLDSKVQLPDGSPIPCILLANKCDQEKQGTVASPEKMEEYVREKGFAGWFETSAKENINIEESARALVNKILLNDKLISTADLADNERFNLNTTSDQTTTEPKSKCAC